MAAWVLEKRPSSYRIWFESVSKDINQFWYCMKCKIQITTANYTRWHQPVWIWMYCKKSRIWMPTAVLNWIDVSLNWIDVTKIVRLDAEKLCDVTKVWSKLSTKRRKNVAKHYQDIGGIDVVIVSSHLSRKLSPILIPLLQRSLFKSYHLAVQEPSCKSDPTASEIYSKLYHLVLQIIQIDQGSWSE